MKRGFTLVELMIVVTIVATLLGVVVIGIMKFTGNGDEMFTDNNRSRAALEAQGFTDIQTTGYQWGACGKDDDYSTGFTATNPLGRRVSGVVCCGYYKGCTVRF